MFKQNLAACINTQRKDKEGRYPVRIRATVKRKVTYYPTGVMVSLAQWDKAAREVKLHPNKNLLNIAISTKIAEIEKQFIEQSLAGSSAQKIIPKKQIDFFLYAESKIKQAKGKETASTLIHKESYLKKFKAFRASVKITECTPALLLAYEKHCRGLGNKANTVWGSVKYVRSVINAAVNEGVVNSNPLRGYKSPVYNNPERMYITEQEMAKLELIATDESINPTFRNAANWFLFSCYCGLRYGDAASFTKDKIINGRLILRTGKKGVDVTIKVHPKLLECVERLGSKLTTNQDYNRSLKAVALVAGINKPLTSHIARHSFAVMFLNKGGSIEALSKILGHTTIRTTQIYGKITDIRLDDEIDRVFKE